MALLVAPKSLSLDTKGECMSPHQAYVGAIVQHVGSGKLGTIKEIFSDQDCMTRAKVQHFNGEFWDWTPPVSLLEEIA